MKIILPLYRTENVTPAFDKVYILVQHWAVNSVLIYHLTVGGGDNINYHYPRSERVYNGRDI